MTIKKDKIKVLRITLLPVSLILFMSFNLLNNTRLDEPLWGINRMFFYAPALVIFSILIILNLVILFQKEYGINIGDTLFIRTSIFKGLELNWNAIEAFKLTKKKHIGVVLKDPETLITNETSSVLKKSYKRNLKFTGAPVILATNLLNMKPDAIFELLNKELKERTL